MGDVRNLLIEILDRANEVPPTKIAALLTQLAAVQNTLVIRLLANGLEQKTSDCEADEDQLLTAKEAAALLGLKTNYVRSLARNRNLPSIRQGRYVRFSRSDIREWIKQKRHVSATLHIPYNVANGRKNASTKSRTSSVYESRIRGPKRKQVEPHKGSGAQACVHQQSASVVDQPFSGAKGK
jgi:excisionase family DNA binding protein